MIKAVVIGKRRKREGGRKRERGRRRKRRKNKRWKIYNRAEKGKKEAEEGKRVEGMRCSRGEGCRWEVEKSEEVEKRGRKWKRKGGHAKEWIRDGRKKCGK